MKVQVHAIPLGLDNCYLLRGDGLVLVDAGMPGKVHVLARALDRLSVQPSQVGLVHATHAHWDHVGSAAAIKALTGAPLALHRSERAWLERPEKPMPTGFTTWGRVFVAAMRPFLPLVKLEPTGVDMVLGDEGLPLDSYGIPGRIVHTPGHSPGSTSLVLDTGEAFVGDLAMSGFPLRTSPGLPILGQDQEQVRTSWLLLLEMGVRQVFPAHGKPFPAQVIREALGR